MNRQLLDAMLRAGVRLLAGSIIGAVAVVLFGCVWAICMVIWP
jgi:hypothetical protein